MITTNQIFLIVILFIIYIKKTYEIDCYSCLYDTCPLPFNASGLLVRTMKSNSGWCLKIIKKEPGEPYQYKRGAAAMNACTRNKCQLHPRAPDTRLSCCCNKNLCNASQRLMLTITVLMIVVTMLF